MSEGQEKWDRKNREYKGILVRLCAVGDQFSWDFLEDT